LNFPIIQKTYQFECTRCGNCCSGEQQVNLNPYDLYKMAVYKGYNHTRELFENNIVHLVQAQNNAWIPQIKFKSIKRKKRQSFCPFLINELDEHDKLLGLCSLHPDKKPLICAMAPAGRIQDFKNNSEEYIFVKPAADCPGVDIQKENKLSDLILSKKKELDYEKRFLKMLDALDQHYLAPEFYYKSFYSFSTCKIFENILQEIELLQAKHTHLQ